MSFIPNKYQEDVFKFIHHQVERMNSTSTDNTPHHAVVEAVAGSGKTKTIVEALNIIPRNLEVNFTAFNKHIAEELKTRAPNNVRVMTLHSMGLQAITKAFGRVQVDDKKLYDIINQMFMTDYAQLEQEKVDYYAPIVRQLVSLMKATILPVEHASIVQLIDHYGIEADIEDVPMLYDMTSKVLSRCKASIKTIDFDDMIWMPVIYNLGMYKYDFVFIDEAQDLNRSQAEMILKAVKPTGSVITVGDRNQSLYGFRGADTESIPNLISKLNATVLPLSITYRCPKKHVELAKHFVPQIEAADHAEDGAIVEIKSEKMCETIQPKDMVVCRYNAPLVKLAYQLLAKGIRVTIRGRDIGEGLITLINKLNPHNIEDFYDKLDKWHTKEVAKAQLKDKNPEAIHDKFEALQAISEGCEDVIQLKKKISSIFSDNNSEVVFSSIHRAKGLEASNVYVLQPQLMPSQYAKKDWEMQQEQNCQYVAYTRAKKNLYLVR